MEGDHGDTKFHQKKKKETFTDPVGVLQVAETSQGDFSCTKNLSGCCGGRLVLFREPLGPMSPRGISIHCFWVDVFATSV